MTKNKLVIGIDGGGTKTTAVLADKKEHILKRAVAGSSSPRNVGVSKTVSVLKELIEELNREEVDRILIGLPSILEQPRYRKEVQNSLDKELPSLKNKLNMVSDQRVAFRSGTDQENGVLLIAGTGSVAHGWWKSREARASGWGWLADEGSAFWIGQKALRTVFKSMDGREKETKIKKIALSESGIEEKELISKVYAENPRRAVARFSAFCGQAAQEGDEKAQEIMRKAAEELSLSFGTVVKKLNIQDESFPLVLVGGVFNSSFLFKILEKKVLETTPGATIVRPDKEPVHGAVRLALDQ